MKHFLTLGLLLLYLAFLKSSDYEEVPLLSSFSLQDIEERIEDSCFLVSTSTTNSTTLQLLRNMTGILKSDSDKVSIGVLVDDESFLTGKEGVFSYGKGDDLGDLALYPRRIGGRKCLLRPPVSRLKSQIYKGEGSLQSLLQFINTNCGTHRRLDGSLTKIGVAAKSILNNVYQVPKSDTEGNSTNGPLEIGAMCERIAMPSQEEFLNKYLFRSKPVIITDAIKHWPAIQKWTNEFLIAKYSNTDTRVAFAPSGEYEGCEKAENYEEFKTFKLPDEVKKQLPFPDLVVVRPAFMNIKFAKFMDLLEGRNSNLTKMSNISAYLEYTSIPSYFPELEQDIQEMPCAAGLLNRKHLNIWLSDGNTLGKLHFDPFENFLCQISGKKQVILYEPHDNTRLYEAHIQESMLEYNHAHKEFRRKKLLDSTSMVMSPVDILKPDYERFPKFQGVRAMNCTINEGEVLFMPSFWWHEVQSYPSHINPRNLAVNFWYEPFFSKDYPCESCKLEVNPSYHHLLG
ncbi:bifunctional peptidase and (3S)-lysyl hydroxylase Jmjd7 [Nematostella vectensis]|uniref:bifunctional peptidase and (3S)-lysyl hydroxylase Jmjd7 n=1 Tax=Nematostella vectensis TaxID=45351 RepID=UPI002077250A|nr:bifunctional peptidase and (3S)-lysyl hydroxylase Jmjd7 [Nematostella vectensis]